MASKMGQFFKTEFSEESNSWPFASSEEEMNHFLPIVGGYSHYNVPRQSFNQHSILPNIHSADLGPAPHMLSNGHGINSSAAGSRLHQDNHIRTSNGMNSYDQSLPAVTTSMASMASIAAIDRAVNGPSISSQRKHSGPLYTAHSPPNVQHMMKSNSYPSNTFPSTSSLVSSIQLQTQHDHHSKAHSLKQMPSKQIYPPHSSHASPTMSVSMSPSISSTAQSDIEQGHKRSLDAGVAMSQWQTPAPPSSQGPGPKRRKSSLREPWQPTEDDKLLVDLKDHQLLPWKQITIKFEEMGKGQHRVPALQMRLKRIKERMRHWSEDDLTRLREAKEYIERQKWESISNRMVELGCEKIPPVSCERKWKELEGHKDNKSSRSPSLGLEDAEGYEIDDGWNASSSPTAPVATNDSGFDKKL